LFLYTDNLVQVAAAAAAAAGLMMHGALSPFHVAVIDDVSLYAD